MKPDPEGKSGMPRATLAWKESADGACGQVVCGSCQEENRGVVCRECAARQEAHVARKPPGVAPPPYHRRRTQSSPASTACPALKRPTASCSSAGTGAALPPPSWSGSSCSSARRWCARNAGGRNTDEIDHSERHAPHGPVCRPSRRSSSRPTFRL